MVYVTCRHSAGKQEAHTQSELTLTSGYYTTVTSREQWESFPTNKDSRGLKTKSHKLSFCISSTWTGMICRPCVSRTTKAKHGIRFQTLSPFQRESSRQVPSIRTKSPFLSLSDGWWLLQGNYTENSDSASSYWKGPFCVTPSISLEKLSSSVYIVVSSRTSYCSMILVSFSFFSNKEWPQLLPGVLTRNSSM